MKSTPAIRQIFFRSPESQTPTRSVVFENPNHTLQNVKASIYPQSSVRDSIFFTINGKTLANSTFVSQIPNLSTLTVHLRLNGGGGDGGSTCAESRDCFLNMYAEKKPDKVDPNEMKLSKCLNCSLSNEPLRHPIVVDKLGNLFNKEALVEGLLKKNLPKEFGYIKGLKDMISVELTDVPGDKEIGDVKFQCPITGLEMNGKNKFFAIRTCGHVMSAKGFKEVKSSSCLICHKEFVASDKLVINGSEDEVKELWEKLKEEAQAKDNVKKSKKVKNGDVNGKELKQLSGSKHTIEASIIKGNTNGGKKLKVEEDALPTNAKSKVYASIFTSSKKKSDFRETYSCRSLPLGRN